MLCWACVCVCVCVRACVFASVAFLNRERKGFGRACRSDLGRGLRSKLNGFSTLVLHLALGD